MSTSDMAIKATVGRYGTFNAVNIEIQKREESATNAAFESAYSGAKGKPFYFGFRSGAPVAFVVTEVGNNAKVQQGIFAAKGVTTVVLSAVVPDSEMAALRDALTSRQIDAVRMDLTGDVRLEKAIDDKNGKKLMEKFSCFYQSLDKNGITLSAAADPKSQPGQSASVGDDGLRRDYAISAQGKYVRKGKSSDFLELGPEGAFSLVQDGTKYGGMYKVEGDTLIGTISGLKVQNRLRFIGDSLIDPSGTPWEKQAAPQKSTAAPLTIDQIIQMVAAKLPDDIIITTIRKSNSKFEPTPEALIKLKTGGVNDAVIRAMTQ